MTLDHFQLQQLWWVLLSLVGALLLAMTFVQGGQTLLWTTTRGEQERTLVVNALGRKWELTFTLLVLFGGAFFAAFPRFYAVSFGGAYWLWMLILITFVLQGVSFEFRNKAGNLFGPRGYEGFLFLNGSLGLLALGAAVGTLFTGGSFVIDGSGRMSWGTPLHGLEALLTPYNVILGLALVLTARVLGALYLIQAIEAPNLTERLRESAWKNLLAALPLILFLLLRWHGMTGYGYAADGAIVAVAGKYLDNLIALGLFGIGFAAIGLALLAGGTGMARFTPVRGGVWLAAAGALLFGLALFLVCGLNETAFYPSLLDPAASLTIRNASSSRYTLAVMAWAALSVPLILGYVAYVWRLMGARPLVADEVKNDPHHSY
ncbi:MAG: cytochrome d ubiquinol oxidase subunit II [Deltaproteobacteria bacterium]|nr:cytochrome d ubiquinol oxidase subunit II [Deltaproteobacteria bacterium]